MKKLLLLLLLFNFTGALIAQALEFGIINKETTATEVTFDVTLTSDVPFKLGSGLLYFNFNTAAFGEFVVTNDAVTITRPTGSVLAQTNLFDIYTSFITNDNTASRFAFSWQQGLSDGSIPENNITATPAVLFSVSIAFTAGGEGEIDDICFESSEIFDDQTFTACGPYSGVGFSDCFNDPGSQLTDDVFTCEAVLPLDLLSFTGETRDKTNLLTWTTANEEDFSHFEVERSSAEAGAQRPDSSADRWEMIAEVSGGQSSADESGPGPASADEQPYSYTDHSPLPTAYYRLKMIDLDGTFSYSEMVFLEHHLGAGVHGLAGTMLVYPNPNNGQFTVDLSKVSPSADQPKKLCLIDLHGREVWTTIASSNQQATVTIPEPRPGVYLLQLSVRGDLVSVQRVVVR